MQKKNVLTAAVLVTAIAGTAMAQLPIRDPFNSAATATNYTVVDGNLTSNNEVVFGYDFSAITVGGNPISESPNFVSGDTAKTGLSTRANINDAARGVVSVYRNEVLNQSFSLFVDIFPYNELAASSTTEPFHIGINHSGTKIINWYQAGTAEFPQDTDGYWTVNHPDNGDFALTFQEGFSGGFSDNEEAGLLWGDGLDGSLTGNARRDGSEAFLKNVLYPTTGTAADGTPANSWYTYLLTWDASIGELRGYVIDQASYSAPRLAFTYNDPDDTYTSGQVLLGHEDSYGGLEPTIRYIWDNLRIEPLTATVADWTMY